MLDLLGISNHPDGREHVAILVGPNGSGKSNFLKELALEHRHGRHLLVISNTAHDRFANMRGMKRLSASRARQSPKAVIKNAVALSLDEPDSRFYQIGAILEHCGYQPKFGFRVRGNGKWHGDTVPPAAQPRPWDFDESLGFLSRFEREETIWIDQREEPLRFSILRGFSAVLRMEDVLRREMVIDDIQVVLRKHDGAEVELLDASSGELALISSLVFLIASIAPDPVILIDEPENSLHPSWQREYLDKLLAAIAYRNATIVIATHAPLVVTGALAQSSELVSIFQIQDGRPVWLNFSEAKASAGNIEGILWRAFDVITPASHFVSEELVGVVKLLEQGEINEEQALARVDEMDRHSYDDKQHAFFGAVRELIGKVEEGRQKEEQPDG